MSTTETIVIRCKLPTFYRCREYLPVLIIIFVLVIVACWVCVFSLICKDFSALYVFFSALSWKLDLIKKGRNNSDVLILIKFDLQLDSSSKPITTYFRIRVIKHTGLNIEFYYFCWLESLYDLIQ